MTTATLTTTIREGDLQQHIEEDLPKSCTGEKCLAWTICESHPVQVKHPVRCNDLIAAERTKYCPRNPAGYLLPPPIPTPTITTSWLPMR